MNSREREKGTYFSKTEWLSGAKNAISPFEEIVVQLPEGGEGFGVRYECDNAAGGGQNSMDLELAEAAGYRTEQGGVVLAIFPYNKGDGCKGGAFGKG